MKKCDEMRKDKKLGVGFEESKGFTKYVFGDTIDELIEGLEQLKDGRFINDFVFRFPNLSEEQLERIDVVMPQTDDAKEISEYACERGKVSNTADFEDALIRLKVLYCIRDFARYVEGANIQKLEDAIVESKETYEIVNFSREVKGADLLRLKKVIFETCTTENAFNMAIFCREHQEKPGVIEQEDVQKTEKIIIESKDTLAILVFASDVKGVNIQKLQDAIIKTENAEAILSFAHRVEGANINKLRDAINKTGDDKRISEFEEEFGQGEKLNAEKSFFSFFKPKK